MVELSNGIFHDYVPAGFSSTRMVCRNTSVKVSSKLVENCNCCSSPLFTTSPIIKDGWVQILRQLVWSPRIFGKIGWSPSFAWMKRAEVHSWCHGETWWLQRKVLRTLRSCREWGFYKWSTVAIWVFPKIGVPPKSSILIGFSIIINHPFGGTLIFGNTHLLRKGHQTNALRQMVAVRRETQDGGRLGER